MKKQVAKCLASLIYFCSAHSALARLGDGPLVDEMLRCADVVCAGRVTGYDFVATGPTSVWVIAEFTMDHVIKGNAVTNKIGLMGYRLDEGGSTNDIRRMLSSQKASPRCLVFLREVDVKKCQYKLTDDLNGMLPACKRKPSIRSSAVTKERLSVELNQAYSELAVGEREFLELIAGNWLNKKGN